MGLVIFVREINRPGAGAYQPEKTNVQSLIQVIGGLGVFLLGMVIMTTGLKELGGDAMRSALMRFTRSPLSGVATGTMATVILQSSSATTVAAVGFVGAGLMTFSQSLGIIFGANLGTTIKGWLIALLGFKFNLGEVVLPLIFLGTVMRLFGHGRLASAGFALAGFSLLFLGISILQEGVSHFHGLISEENFPGDTLFGRFKLLLLGVLVTLITQSSSAGVAMALSALFAGIISFEQAAALVIGMDVGTTVTAALATLGGSTGARRTGLSHVIYNLFTGTAAFFLLVPYARVLDGFMPGVLVEQAELALVGFHTFFNLLGVIAVLPVAGQFARFIERVIPERAGRYTGALTSALLEQPALALGAVHQAVREETVALFQALIVLLTMEGRDSEKAMRELQVALDETHTFLDHIHFHRPGSREWDQFVSLLHTLDHLQRLQDRCEEEAGRAAVLRMTPAFSSVRERLLEDTRTLVSLIRDNRWDEAAAHAERLSNDLHAQVEPLREAIVADIASDTVPVPEATRRLEAIRWMDRVSGHQARIIHHYRKAVAAAAKEPEGALGA